MMSPTCSEATATPLPEIPRVRLGNVPLTPVSMAQALDLIAAWAQLAPMRLVVTPNVDHIITLQRRPDFQAVYERADLSLPDGMPVLWAARYLGLGRIEKVSGSDLAPALCARGAREGWRIFFAGGPDPDGLRLCLDRIATRYPGLTVGGHCPPFGFEHDSDANEALLRAIEAFTPDVLMMAVGAPRSELWLDRHRDRIARGVALGIGRALYFLAGLERRAPRFMQRAGLEWLWRLAHEPRRLAKRYLVDDLRFFPLVWRWKHDRTR